MASLTRTGARILVAAALGQTSKVAISASKIGAAALGQGRTLAGPRFFGAAALGQGKTVPTATMPGAAALRPATSGAGLLLPRFFCASAPKGTLLRSAPAAASEVIQRISSKSQLTLYKEFLYLRDVELRKLQELEHKVEGYQSPSVPAPPPRHYTAIILAGLGILSSVCWTVLSLAEQNLSEEEKVEEKKDE